MPTSHDYYWKRKNGTKYSQKIGFLSGLQLLDMWALLLYPSTMPIIFPLTKWYLVLCSYIIAHALAFCNSYGTGLTDWSLASTYGKIGLFIFASLVSNQGSVLAGLAACSVMMSIVVTTAAVGRLEEARSLCHSAGQVAKISLRLLIYLNAWLTWFLLVNVFLGSITMAAFEQLKSFLHQSPSKDVYFTVFFFFILLSSQHIKDTKNDWCGHSNGRDLLYDLCNA